MTLSDCCIHLHVQETKILLRGDFVDEWMRYLEPEAANAWNLLAAPETIHTLGKVLERLTGKSPQPPHTSRL